MHPTRAGPMMVDMETNKTGRQARTDARPRKLIDVKLTVTSHGRQVKDSDGYFAELVRDGRGLMVQITQGCGGPAGSWALATLAGVDGYGSRVNGPLAIDFGQEWYIVNGGELVTAALNLALSEAI